MTGPAQNRVTPYGTVEALPGRGCWMGNRGRLHEGSGTRRVVRSARGRAWITCQLRFRNRRVVQWDAAAYTPLFFLDEAVALAAGHRPCAECRRADFRTYQELVGPSGGPPVRAPELDRRLERERRPLGAGRVTAHPWASLPDGTFVVTDRGPAVVVGDHLTRWRRDNSYGERLPRPATGTAAVLTPPTTLAVLAAGYPVQVDPSAR